MPIGFPCGADFSGFVETRRVSASKKLIFPGDGDNDDDDDNNIRVPFLESPGIFRAHFGEHNSLCIFKTKASRGTKLCSYFNFYFLYNIMKRPALQNKQVGVLRMAFRARNVFGTFEKRAPGCSVDIGDLRILWLLHRILWLNFACFLKELCLFVIILLLQYSLATPILNENPEHHQLHYNNS